VLIKIQNQIISWVRHKMGGKKGAGAPPGLVLNTTAKFAVLDVAGIAQGSGSSKSRVGTPQPVAAAAAGSLSEGVSEQSHRAQQMCLRCLITYALERCRLITHVAAAHVHMFLSPHAKTAPDL
jgi:hypothetical protein